MPKIDTLNPADAPRDALREVFEEARGGDAGAQDKLCRALRPGLYRVAFSYVHDADIADDIAQEALIRALTKRFLFLGRATVSGWATKIAVNLAKNSHRDRNRRKEILGEAGDNALSAHGISPAEVPSPDAIMGAKEQRHAFEVALQKLSARQRDVARLRLLGELSFEEIGRALSMKEANARVTFHQARQHLSAHLDNPDARKANDK